MSFWSGERLQERLPALIGGFDASRIDCAAYRLRVGPEVYISPTSEAKDARTQTKARLADGQGFAIPPGQFAFLLTEERVSVPPDAIGFISVRATVKFRGLVNVSGFHVDPGYDGRLVFSVFNAGPAPVHLQRGDDCFLIWYADLDRPSAHIYSGPGFDGIPTRLINPIAGEIQSFEGLLAKIKETDKKLTDRLQAIQREQTALRWAAYAIAVVVLTWAGRAILPPWAAAPIAGQPAASSPVQPTAATQDPAPGPSTGTQYRAIKPVPPGPQPIPSLPRP